MRGFESPLLRQSKALCPNGHRAFSIPFDHTFNHVFGREGASCPLAPAQKSKRKSPRPPEKFRSQGEIFMPYFRPMTAAVRYRRRNFQPQNSPHRASGPTSVYPDVPLAPNGRPRNNSPEALSDIFALGNHPIGAHIRHSVGRILGTAKKWANSGWAPKELSKRNLR